MSFAPLRALGALALSLGLTGAALAQSSAPPDYTARAVHQQPDGSATSGLVIKSGPDMRLEYSENGRDVVQIIRRAEGVSYFLDTATQTYAEIRGTPAPDPTGAGYLPPCQEDDPDLACTFVGTEVISGITAEVWEIAVSGQPDATTILWDGARHRALRQSMPDGSVMRMAFLAMVEMSGRAVEHWSVSYETPGEPAQAGAWYYDPELRLEVREDMASGAVRALEDIRVGPVDPALFEVPSGWTKLDPPPGSTPGQGN
jgi:hypothetical protein